MPNSQFRLSMIAAAVTALFAPALQAATAGKIDFATPGVNAVGPNGQSRPVGKGSELQTGEIIDTGSGRAQLRFTDGGLISLQPQTQFRVESYGYDKDDSNKNSVVMNLLKGGLRSITGLIGKTNRQGYKLQTATATVGIRGTEFSVTGLPNGTILFNCTDG
ncbi:MAG: fecR family protein, partial [Mucilaginibacter sp.]|nr:fecR family protein [Mucilaginibacter sp.]